MIALDPEGDRRYRPVDVGEPAFAVLPHHARALLARAHEELRARRAQAAGAPERLRALGGFGARGGVAGLRGSREEEQRGRRERAAEGPSEDGHRAQCKHSRL